MLAFCGRYAGIIIALIVAALWWFLPSWEVALFKANQQALLMIAALLPAAAGKFLSGLIEIVQALQTALSAPKLFMSAPYAAQFQATVAVIVNTALVLVEIKVIRWSVMALRLVTWPFRRWRKGARTQGGSGAEVHELSQARRARHNR